MGADAPIGIEQNRCEYGCVYISAPTTSVAKLTSISSSLLFKFEHAGVLRSAILFQVDRF